MKGDLHCSLWSVDPGSSILCKDICVQQIRNRDIDWLARLRLEAELTIPSHVLDGEEGAIGDDNHVVVTITD